ncbi:MAG: hypothetical protein R3F03_05200 [Opitutaceae bacterium]
MLALISLIVAVVTHAADKITVWWCRWADASVLGLKSCIREARRRRAELTASGQPVKSFWKDRSRMSRDQQGAGGGELRGRGALMASCLPRSATRALARPVEPAGRDSGGDCRLAVGGRPVNTIATDNCG